MGIPVAHFDVKMGDLPDKSFIEVSAAGQVLPKGFEMVVGMPRQQIIEAGYDVGYFDSQLNPIHLDIKPGTEGVVRISVNVAYDFWEQTSSHAILPDHQTGNVSCRGSWLYNCSKEGELVLIPFAIDDSQTSDHFSVTIDRPLQANPKPGNGMDPFIFMFAKPVYGGKSGSPGLTIPVPIPDTPIKVPVQIPGVPSTPAKTGSALPFFVYLHVPKPLPVPQKPLPPELRGLLLTAVFFAKEDQDKVDDKINAAIQQWYDGFEQFGANHRDLPNLLDAIRDDKLTIYCDGYASITGTNKYNTDKAWNRATNVREYIHRKLGISTEKVKPETFGSKGSEWDTEVDARGKVVIKPRDKDRCVVIWVKTSEIESILRGPMP
jgi:hypothetical protein